MSPSTSPQVVVIGAGPVGMIAALLLATYGHRVVVLERDDRSPPTAHARFLTDQAMRTLAAVGVADRVLPFLAPHRSFEWCGADADVLARLHFAERGRCGWPELSTMFQPDLDAALERACRDAPEVDLRRGRTVVDIAGRSESVEVDVVGPDGPETVTARYAVACDGGDSTVRSALGIAEDDFGFDESWLVCDFRLHRPMDLPHGRLTGDPAGPVTTVGLGHRHHRFSFLLDPSADPACAGRPDPVWDRVAAFLSPADAELVRCEVYRFRSVVAQQWRVGRVFLAGDAAHRLPRQFGEGLGAGVHDVQNLAFKLDLVLRGARGEEILDSYQLEREPQVGAAIRSAIAWGRMFSLRDPTAAAARDRQLRAEHRQGRTPQRASLPLLAGELFAARSRDGRGELSVNGLVDDGTRRARLDQIVGPGFTVVVDALALPDFGRSATAVSLHRAGVQVVMLSPARRPPGPDTGPGALAVTDVEGVYERWLAEQGWAAVAIRPDFYVFGAATTTGGTRVLAAELVTAVGG